MITGECLPGEDAEILVEAIKIAYSGEFENWINNPVVYVKPYKQAAVSATGATALFDSTMGQYLVTIPAAFVPASGFFDFVLKGDDISDVLGRIAVNTGDAAITALQADVDAIKAITDLLTLANINAAVDTALSDYDAPTKTEMDTAIEGNMTGEHIIQSYTFDPTHNTVTITEEGYTDIIQEQILSVFNSTTGQWYYNSELRRYGAEPGKPWTKYFPLTSVAAGVITYTAPDTSAAAEDVLQIIVNKA